MKTIFFSLVLICSTLASFAADYWEKITTPSNKNLLKISFGSKSTGYIAGTDSTLLKTTNGGISWNKLSFSGMKFSAVSPDIVDIKFTDANTGYAIVGNSKNEEPLFQGGLYKTVDGGLSWTVSFSDFHCLKSYFFDAANGFMLGAGDFGQTFVSRLKAGVWEAPQLLDMGIFLHAADFYDAKTGIIGGNKGLVYRTFNGGLTYDTVKTNIDTNIHALLYLNENTILAATSNVGAAMIISKDKGKTWDYDGFSLTFHYPEMKAVARSKKDSLIIAGKSTTTDIGVIYYFGSPFMNIDNAEQTLNDVGMRDDSIAYIVGDSGLVLSNRHIATGINESEMLLQTINIYPNPANQELNIELPEIGLYQITILDVLGKTVLTEAEHKGKVNVQTAKLAQGQYIIRVEDGFGHQLNKKLVINR